MPLDLNNLKEQVQTIFQAANTTTASTDLSSGLARRVRRVVKLNPALIPIQANWYPYVSVYIDSKDVTLEDFAGTQALAKRSAEVNLKIVGGVWNTLDNDDEVDEADEDCESLMENIEAILRDNPTLGNAALWSRPERIQYYNMGLGEGACLRAGVMDLKATIFY